VDLPWSVGWFGDTDQTLAATAVIYLVAYQILQILDMSLTISRPEQFHDGRSYVDPSAPNSRGASPNSESATKGDPKGETSIPMDVADEQVVEGPTKSSKNWRGPKRGQGQSSAIELRLVGAVLIALKLIYGLDGTPRFANSKRV
jgi:hypothetical protein